jgi:hypothetical protein
MNDHKKISHEAFVAELNGRNYTLPFRMAYLNAGLTPYEFIRATLFSSSTTNAEYTIESNEITQDELINKIESLGTKFYDELSTRHRELVNSIRPQWRNKTMTKPAREFAIAVLGVLENFEARTK